jgi:starch synthase
MRIAMVSAECEPFAKVGGLADAVDGLARALGRRGHEVAVYLPRYGHDRLPFPVTGRHGQQVQANGGSVSILDVPADGYLARLVEHPASFDRPAIYGPAGADYPDNGARFALLGQAALADLATDAAAGHPTDVLQSHDWQAAPALLGAWDRALAGDPPRPALVQTCHNLAYQGRVPAAQVHEIAPRLIPASGEVNLLRLALERADMANTVSPTYARESLTPESGAGLESVLAARGDRYVGIVNGLDPELWNPATDPDLAAPYSPADPSGKQVDKTDLLRRHRLTGANEGAFGARCAPLLGMVGRLDPQKGFDLLTAAAPRLLELGARFIVLGTGDPTLVAGLRELAAARPDRLAVIDRFDRAEARRIYAGADLFLMPSRFEPCGQGQMIAMRYGTPPIVRATGGLADTVVDADVDMARGTGFCYGPAEPAALLGAVERALAAYGDPQRWRALVHRGMTADWSWDQAAGAYESTFERAVGIARQNGR